MQYLQVMTLSRQLTRIKKTPRNNMETAGNLVKNIFQAVALRSVRFITPCL